MRVLPYSTPQNLSYLILVVASAAWLLRKFSGSSNITLIAMSIELESRVFDVDRCIELHNQLVRIGWEGSGQDFEGTEMQTWWEMYGADCDEQDLTLRLIPEVIDFLKGALQPDPEETGSDSPYQKLF